MPVGILADNGDGVSSADGDCLPEKIVLNRLLDLSHLLKGISLVVDSVDEEINVGGRGKLLMIPLAEGTLAFAMLFGYSEERGQDSGSSDDDVAPVCKE